ncbi:DUF2251 domain-containing protein [Verrucomicrobiaceae bacterium R5-34]|nr:DUF2251 domain-containing protein [Verrucomicrobiaceae bacterium R5-34]
MNAHIGVEDVIEPGQEKVIESDIPSRAHGVVFEDDGETGYFYARDYSNTDQLFCDALHIYSVEDVVDREIPSDLMILWSPDYSKAALLINSYPHAVFDFNTQCGYSRDNFPEPDPDSGWSHMVWSDSLRGSFA